MIFWVIFVYKKNKGKVRQFFLIICSRDLSVKISLQHLSLTPKCANKNPFWWTWQLFSLIPNIITRHNKQVHVEKVVCASLRYTLVGRPKYDPIKQGRESTNRCVLRVIQSYPESFRVTQELPRVTRGRPKVDNMNEKKTGDGPIRHIKISKINEVFQY